ncbi:MAG: sigma 54-interacting transcriptional regulator [Myxococcaceae bacterium]
MSTLHEEEQTLPTRSLSGNHLPLEAVQLVVQNGAAKGARLELTAGTVVAGASRTADLVVRDDTVSKQHASFELLAGAVRVRDLKSRNGTFFLGARVESVVVPLGSSVMLGHAQVAVQAIVSRHEADVEEWHGLVCHSAAMKQLVWRLQRVADSDVTVVLRGESGAGKEAVARALHAAGPRRAKPFEVFDAAGINAELLESELFGHVKGAFTGANAARAGVLERADGGTLLLDHLDQLPLELQPRLLRFLQERTVARVGGGAARQLDVRVIVATQVALDDAVARGHLRSDLYYRLAAVLLEVPTLSARRDDIPTLAKAFVREAGAKVTMGTATLAALQAHPWPGGARELRHAVERAIAFGRFDVDAAPDAVGGERGLKAEKDQVGAAFEADVLRALLVRHRWNVSAVAKEARIARSHLYTLIARYGLQRPR